MWKLWRHKAGKELEGVSRWRRLGRYGEWLQVGEGFLLGVINKKGLNLWWWMYNSMNILKSTELYTFKDIFCSMYQKDTYLYVSKKILLKTMFEMLFGSGFSRKQFQIKSSLHCFFFRDRNKGKERGASGRVVSTREDVILSWPENDTAMWFGPWDHSPRSV